MPVLVYSTPTCPWCHKAKEFLKQQGVPFTDINVAANAQAAEDLVEKSGQMGVPVLDIDGTIIVGFDREAITAALKRRGKSATPKTAAKK